MAWFKRVKTGFTGQDKKNLPDGLWIKCQNCTEVLYKKELENNYSVCSNCGFHFRIPWNVYIDIICDPQSFYETEVSIQSVDPLKFKDSERYADRIKKAISTTGMSEAVKTGTGNINGLSVVLAVMDFRFIGGSMGSVVGEKIARAAELALRRRFPLIIVSASGGARMQEAAYSLMQMAKTSARLALLADAKLPFISILTHPTTGGVTASFAMLGDVILAEPNALIGFAGPRVIKQTIGQDLPDGFQRSEFLLEHGFIDAIVTRKELKQNLYHILTFFIDEKIDETQSIAKKLL
ncbi:acetyl-CoA carboxylase carboxyltransferase subunit beta [candidate division KSB1 bacterium]|nr:acetyl-CoA carboxylase carboxyltransferase subunit beta [candidate division KSB1 bacterium]RQW01160.1 MAG: acetyl-CoA carboxylase carboxyltransferase subunit beta [candidate division KSB1 bacterium]